MKNRPLQAANQDADSPDITPAAVIKPTPKKHRARVYMMRTGVKRTDISTNGRCKYHGGHSTGALTAEGKARQLEGYRCWQRKQVDALVCAPFFKTSPN